MQRVGFGPVVHGLTTDEDQLSAQLPELHHHGLSIGVAKPFHVPALGHALAKIQAHLEFGRTQEDVFVLQLFTRLRSGSQVTIVLVARELLLSRALREVESRCRHTPRMTQPRGARLAGVDGDQKAREFGERRR